MTYERIDNMKKLKDFYGRPWVKRTVRTFVQTAVGYIAVNLAAIDFTAEKSVLTTALLGLAVSAASAGLAAVMNYKKD